MLKKASGKSGHRKCNKGVAATILACLTIALVVPEAVFGSWMEDWTAPGGNVYKLEAFIITDTGTDSVDFAGNGLDTFSQGGWSGSIINPNYALATGSTTVGNMTYFTIFTDTAANQAFTIDLIAYYTSGLIGGQRAIWSGGKPWGLGTWDQNYQYNRTPSEAPGPVPEPATMLLLGTGLVGVAGAARKRKKNQV